MDILCELSCLFFRDSETLDNKGPEGQLLEQVPEELRGKLIEVQTEIAYRNFLTCFLCGLRLGFAAPDLGQGG